MGSRVRKSKKMREKERMNDTREQKQESDALIWPPSVRHPGIPLLRAATDVVPHAEAFDVDEEDLQREINYLIYLLVNVTGSTNN